MLLGLSFEIQDGGNQEGDGSMWRVGLGRKPAKEASWGTRHRSAWQFRPNEPSAEGKVCSRHHGPSSSHGEGGRVSLKVPAKAVIRRESRRAEKC